MNKRCLFDETYKQVGTQTAAQTGERRAEHYKQNGIILKSAGLSFMQICGNLFSDTANRTRANLYK